MSNKKLVRSKNNRVFAGVLGGIAEYFGWRANVLRWGFVLVLLIGIFAAYSSILLILVYALAAVMMPNEGGQA